MSFVKKHLVLFMIIQILVLSCLFLFGSEVPKYVQILFILVLILFMLITIISGILNRRSILGKVCIGLSVICIFFFVEVNTLHLRDNTVEKEQETQRPTELSISHEEFESITNVRNIIPPEIMEKADDSIIYTIEIPNTDANKYTVRVYMNKPGEKEIGYFDQTSLVSSEFYVLIQKKTTRLENGEKEQNYWVVMYSVDELEAPQKGTTSSRVEIPYPGKNTEEGFIILQYQNNKMKLKNREEFLYMHISSDSEQEYPGIMDGTKSIEEIREIIGKETPFVAIAVRNSSIAE